MVIDRRQLLIGAGAALLATPASGGAAKGGRYAAAYAEGEDRYGVAVLDPASGELSRTPLPARGHDVVQRPGSGEAVVFARRPGRFAIAFDIEGRRAPVTIGSERDRHFFGHGVYSADGKLLLSTENDIMGLRGVLGIRDATDGYRPVGTFPTSGVGPHDVALLSDTCTIVVANGGIDTDPSGREPINLDAMRSSLAYLDARTGDILEIVELSPELNRLSIRHLAVCADDWVAFGCQWEGAATEHPALIGLHRRGQAPLMIAAPAATHRRLRGYVGSIASDRTGQIVAATSPKGGIAVHFEVPSARYLGATELADVCGVSGTASPGELFLTSGDGGAILRRPATADSVVMSAERHFECHWDNHVIALERGT